MVPGVPIPQPGREEGASMIPVPTGVPAKRPSSLAIESVKYPAVSPIDLIGASSFSSTIFSIAGSSALKKSFVGYPLS